MSKSDKKKPDTTASTASLPDASSLFDLFKMAKLLGTTATATAWGVLGGIAGEAAWSFWRRLESPFLGRLEFVTIGYCISVAVYTLLIRTQTGVAKNLAFAALLFADGQITNSEYQAMRKTCLKRAGLIEST